MVFSCAGPITHLALKKIGQRLKCVSWTPPHIQQPSGNNFLIIPHPPVIPVTSVSRMIFWHFYNLVSVLLYASLHRFYSGLDTSAFEVSSPKTKIQDISNGQDYSHLRFELTHLDSAPCNARLQQPVPLVAYTEQCGFTAQRGTTSCSILRPSLGIRCHTSFTNVPGGHISSPDHPVIPPFKALSNYGVGDYSQVRPVDFVFYF